MKLLSCTVSFLAICCLPSIADEALALWSGGVLPKSGDLSFPTGIERRPIVPSDPGKTLPPGWMKGVDVAWHKGVLYAAFGSNEKFNEQGENSPGEAAVYLTSRDAGKTWSEVRDIARGEGNTGISHGVFLSHEDQLWFFCGAFEGKLGKARTLAYLLEEATGAWVAKGQIVGDGFWPLQKPMKLPGGNWIMSGLRGGKGSPAAVSISHGDDLMKWDLVVIPQAKALGKMWGESALLRDGGRLINIARYGAEAVALVAESNDGGRSWSPSTPSNLPMTTSKPYAGTLRSSQPYLVCTTTADAGTKRNPLTIAVGKPGGSSLVRIFALDDEGSMMYPGCDEHEGRLFVGYTRGHVPQLAVVPVASLAVDAAGTSRTELNPSTQETPTPAVRDLPLWDERVPLLKAAELPVLPGVRFSVIKPFEFEKDGYRFLHGVGLAFHKGKLYASFGHNKGAENTDTEEARFSVSEDNGKTWSGVRTMDPGDGPVGVSHGAFLSHNGTLWAFHGAYTGVMKGVHTRAYVLDETTQQWEPKGTVIEDGFWPMQGPKKMENGNWIMAGLKVGESHPASVAISHGDDFTKWDVVPIPQAKDLQKMWGESTVIVNGKQITSLSRYGDKAEALIATSEDYGRTWDSMRPSNLPMTTSKPCAGTLSTGQRYLVCTTTANSGTQRTPLTIAVTRPGEAAFSKVFVIRRSELPDGPGESHPRASLSYPDAVEHNGYLYVGYSNSGGNAGRIGTGRELWNNNSAELAVIPISCLEVTR